jgi:lipopolysaccharide transport system permease protein
VATTTTKVFPVPSMTRRVVPRSRFLEIDFAELWRFRELIYFLVWRDVKVRYKQTVIGASWAILQPFMTMVVFSLFFGKLAKLPSNGLPYPIFYYAALLPWTYFATALQTTTNTMVDHQSVITKVYFPRLLLPFSAVISGLVDFAISFGFLLCMMVYYGIRPGAGFLLLPVLVLLEILTALAAGLWLSALNALYRDVRYVMPFLIQFWLFASPVAYPSSLVPERWRWLYGVNPMAGVIEGFRWSVTGHGEAPGKMVLVSAAVVLVALAGGLAYFQRIEGTIADFV